MAPNNQPMFPRGRGQTIIHKTRTMYTNLRDTFPGWGARGTTEAFQSAKILIYATAELPHQGYAAYKVLMAQIPST